MAKERIEIEIDIDNNGEGAKSLKALKQELKESQAAINDLIPGTKAYRDALSKVADVKDRIEDLNEEIAAFQGAGKFQAFANVAGSLAGGFQAAQGAAALFGAESEEVEKALLKVQAASALAEGIKSVEGMGQAFKSLGQILKANPLFLIVSVITAIGAALYALKDKFKPLAAIFDAIGGAIDWVIDKLESLSDALGLSNFEAERRFQGQLDMLDKTKKSVEDRYNQEIKLAQAAGKETFDLERKKFIAVQANINQQIQALLALKKLNGDLTKEQKEQFENLAKQQKDNLNNYAVLVTQTLKHEKDEREKHNKDLAAKAKENAEKRGEENYQAYLKQREFEKLAEEESEELGRLEREKEEKERADKEKAANEAEAIHDKQLADKAAKDKANEEEERKRKAAHKAALLSIEQSAYSGLQSIGELFIKDGEKLKKYQKGLALAQIAVDTGKAIASLVASANANPLNGPTFGAAGIAQYAAGLAQILSNIAKAKQIIQSGQAEGASGGSVSSAGNIQGTFTPTPSLSGVQNTQTKLDSNGNIQKSEPVKAYVVETEMSEKQKQVNRFENNSKF
jgi:hypothetical protein